MYIEKNLLRKKRELKKIYWREKLSDPIYWFYLVILFSPPVLIPSQFLGVRFKTVEQKCLTLDTFRESQLVFGMDPKSLPAQPMITFQFCILLPKMTREP